MVAKWLGSVLNSETIVLALLEPAGEIKHPEKRWGTEERWGGGLGRRVDLKGLDGGLECVAGEGAPSLLLSSSPFKWEVGKGSWRHAVCCSALGPCGLY